MDQTPARPSRKGDDGGAPLVSCIMPTRGRAAFVARAIHYFQRQDYPHRELVIVYEREEDIAPRCGDPSVRYVRTDAPSIGAKRNAAVRHARGELIAQWDDDDWYADSRLSRQLAPILRHEADVTGLNDVLFLQVRERQYWRVSRELFRQLFAEDVCGGTLVYRRNLWDTAGPYPATSLREDADFLERMLRRGARLCRLSGRDLFMYIRHGGNTWKFSEGRHLRPDQWQPATPDELPPGDRAFYAALSASAPAPASATSATPKPPLVSCIMPTRARLAFVPQAIRHFLAQDYPNKELIVIDDGEPSAASLVPAHPAIRYLRLPRRASIGAKRNLACRMAAGSIIVHWDDDDWMAPGWLSSQADTLRRSGADICGLDAVLFYAPASRQAWRYVYDGEQPWVCGGTLCYTKRFWAAHPFPDIDIGEDNAFVWSPHRKRIALNQSSQGYVATVHSGNTSVKDTADRRWHPYPAAAVERLLDKNPMPPPAML